MKKIAKNILLAVIVLIIAFVYAHVDKNYYLYNRNQDGSEYINTGIITEGEILQEFVANEDVINGMNVKCLINGDVEKITVKYQLIDKSNKKVLSSNEVNANFLKSGKFHKFAFPKVKGIQGKKLIFSLKQVGVDKSNGLSFYTGTPVKAQEQNRLLLSGKRADGVLISRTISHRFDMETFIIFLAFVIYIVIFMKALYKLFK